MLARHLPPRIVTSEETAVDSLVPPDSIDPPSGANDARDTSRHPRDRSSDTRAGGPCEPGPAPPRQAPSGQHAFARSRAALVAPLSRPHLHGALKFAALPGAAISRL